MPVLARMLPSPLFVDIRAGAVKNLAALLRERHISHTGRVLVAVGPSLGELIWERVAPFLPDATVFKVEEASLAMAAHLQEVVGGHGYDAIVGIGGGRILDVTKY